MSKVNEGMRSEYDFSGKKGVRGKYAKTLKNGYSVRKYNGQKLVSDNYYASIAPDVHAVFPDSRAINSALRKLIKLVPQKSS